MTVSCVLDILVLLLDTFVCFIVASAGLLGVVPAWSLPFCLVDANLWTTLAWSLVECCSLFPLCCLQLDCLSSTGSTVALPLSLLFIASVCCYYYLLSFLQSSLSFGEQSVRQSTCNQSLTLASPFLCHLACGIITSYLFCPHVCRQSLERSTPSLDMFVLATSIEAQ